jgi:hypothetical protein
MLTDISKELPANNIWVTNKRVNISETAVLLPGHPKQSLAMAKS